MHYHSLNGSYNQTAKYYSSQMMAIKSKPIIFPVVKETAFWFPKVCFQLVFFFLQITFMNG